MVTDSALEVQTAQPRFTLNPSPEGHHILLWRHTNTLRIRGFHLVTEEITTFLYKEHRTIGLYMYSVLKCRVFLIQGW